MTNIDNLCVFCYRDTSFGSGRFVNRVPADNGKEIGYACPECLTMDCDRCDKQIPLDEDILLHDSIYVHYECCTKQERKELTTDIQ